MLSILLPFILPVAHAEPALIPAGSFQQGSGRATDEPIRTVHLSGYRIDRTEVTIAEFEQFIAVGWSDLQWWSVPGLAWMSEHPNGAGADTRAAGRSSDHPVVAVTYWEAEAYCAWRGGELPTEAQWERAACGDGGQRYPWGDDDEVDAIWYSGGKFGHLSDVRTAPAHSSIEGLETPEGLLHMTGNVWEWTRDSYDRNGTAEDPVTDPISADSGPWRVLRGGSFMNLPSYCTCTHREPARPDRVAFTSGFRCSYPDEDPNP